MATTTHSRGSWLGCSLGSHHPLTGSWLGCSLGSPQQDCCSRMPTASRYAACGHRAAIVQLYYGFPPSLLRGAHYACKCRIAIVTPKGSDARRVPTAPCVVLCFGQVLHGCTCTCASVCPHTLTRMRLRVHMAGRLWPKPRIVHDREAAGAHQRV